jgi:hypothetical protein
MERNQAVREFLSECVPLHFHSARLPPVHPSGRAVARGLPIRGSMWKACILTLLFLLTS